MKGRAIFTMLLSKVDMKTPVATMRKMGHLFAGEDTGRSCCLGEKSGIGRPVAMAGMIFGTVSQLG